MRFTSKIDLQAFEPSQNLKAKNKKSALVQCCCTAHDTELAIPRSEPYVIPCLRTKHDWLRFDATFVLTADLQKCMPRQTSRCADLSVSSSTHSTHLYSQFQQQQRHEEQALASKQFQMQYLQSKELRRMSTGREAVTSGSCTAYHPAHGSNAYCELQPPQRYSINDVQSSAGTPLLVPSSRQHVSHPPCFSRLNTAQSTDRQSTDTQTARHRVCAQYPTATQLIDSLQLPHSAWGKHS